MVVSPEGVTDVWLDDFTLIDNGGPMYVLPEESLDDLKYTKANGNWTLEVWDNRAGAAVPTPELLSWRLEFEFSRTPPQAVSLQHRARLPITWRLARSISSA